MAQRPPQWLQPLEVVMGILSITVALVVLLSIGNSMRSLVSLLSLSMVFFSIMSIVEGGVRKYSSFFRALGLLGGLAVGAIAIINLFDPGLRFATLVTLFASAFVVYGIIRLANILDFQRPLSMRLSGLTVGSTTLVFAGLAFAFPDVARISLVGILSISVFINGAGSIVSGIRPSNPKQTTLIKLIAFAFFYGLLIVNWIDLFGSKAPGYHIWLILIYLAPFDVLLVFQGLKDWQLAVCLALIVSLVNDLDYYITGDLFFGFHVNLISWLAGQLGFLGEKVLFTFDAGLFTVPISSITMGLSVYVRIAIVTIILHQWWKAPWRLRA